MHIFYIPDISTGLVTLNEEESRHCIKVLRLREGDEVCLVDGKGGFYRGRLSNAFYKACSVEIIETIPAFGRRDYNLVLGIAPVKNTDRFEWFLEKATEIGIDRIIPMQCEHSERKTLNKVRMEKIITSAVKQSLKAYQPVLSDMLKFSDVTRMDFDGSKFIASCDATEKDLLKDLVVPLANTLILVGPEGDFSPKELNMAVKHGFVPVSLGKSRFRTETAAVLACHTIYLANNCP